MLVRTPVLISALGLPVFAADDAGAAQEITWKMVTLKKDLPGCQTKPAPLKCASVDLSYPVVMTAPSEQAKMKIDQDIQDILLTPLEKGTSPSTPDQFAAGILNHYKSWLQHGGNAKSPWEVERKIDVNFHSPNVLGFRLVERVEQGSQHPAKNTVYFNFRTSDGSMIQLTDVIAEKHLDEFADIAEKHYQGKSKHVRPGEDPKRPDSEEEEGGFDLPKNFAIEKDGLRFRYEEDQPDPHSIRTPEFVIKYSEIKPLLRPDMKLP